MSKLRTKVKPNDLSANMPLRLGKEEEILKTADGTEGYIEFWAADALSIKGRLSAIQNEFVRIALIQNKRTTKDIENMSATALQKEMDKMRELSIEGLSIRVKSWLLVDEAGELVDLPLTIENARDIFSDDELREYAQDWLENSKNAFLPKKSES